MPWNPLVTLSSEQHEKLQAYKRLLLDFNRKFNLVSRESEKHFEECHLLHVLSLTVKCFPDGSTVVDWGTGGGLPAIPLAVCYPRVNFVAIDSVSKKIMAVSAMARRLGLENLQTWDGRAETWSGRTHYSVSRATAPLADLWSWHKASAESLDHDPGSCWQPGLISLKGGDLTSERKVLHERYPDQQVVVQNLYQLLGRTYFKDKYIVEVR